MRNKALSLRAAGAVFTLAALTACGVMGEATSATFAAPASDTTTGTGTTTGETDTTTSGGTTTGDANDLLTQTIASPTPGDTNVTITTTTTGAGTTTSAPTTTTTSGSTTSGTLGTGTTTSGSSTTATGSNTTATTPTTTGGSGTTAGTTTSGSTTTSTTACAETWTSYASNFFETRCVGCHTSMGSYNNVVSGAATIRVYIASRSMPRGSILSAQDYNKILDWFDCTPATPQ